jgi:iron complex outermembrane receptor protein
VEFEAAYQILPSLTLSASGAYNEAIYDSEWLVAKAEIDTSLPQYSGANIRNRFNDFNGEQLANAPIVTFNLGLNYQVHLGNYLARATLNNSYRSGTYVNSNRAAATYQDAYSLTNLGLGLLTDNQKYELSLNVRNLFDEFYATSKGVFTSQAARSLQMGAPRFWEVAIRVKL